MKKISLIASLVVILLIGSLVAYRFYPAKNTPSKAYAEITFPDTGTGSQTYFSKKFNLKIAFPKDFYLRANEDDQPDGSYGGSIEISNVPRDSNFPGLKKNIFSMEIGDTQSRYDGKPIEEWVKDFESGLPEGISETKSSQKIIIDDKEAIIEISSSIYGDVYSIYIPYKNHVFGILGPLVESDYADYFLEVVKSFKFGE